MEIKYRKSIIHQSVGGEDMALQHFPDKVKEFFERLFPPRERAEEREAPKPARKPKTRDDWAR